MAVAVAILVLYNVIHAMLRHYGRRGCLWGGQRSLRWWNGHADCSYYNACTGYTCFYVELRYSVAAMRCMMWSHRVLVGGSGLGGDCNWGGIGRQKVLEASMHALAALSGPASIGPDCAPALNKFVACDTSFYGFALSFCRGSG